MHRIIGLITAIALAAGAVGCGTDYVPATRGGVYEPDNALWQIIRSPNTGHCYEMVIWAHGRGPARYVYAGMAGVPCPEGLK